LQKSVLQAWHRIGFYYHLFNARQLQATGPLVAYYGPTALIMLASQIGLKSFFKIAIEHYFDLYAFIPILNASAVLGIVGAYRVAFLNHSARVVFGIGKRVGLGKYISTIPEWVENYTNSDGHQQGTSAVSPLPPA
jgi:hypothetical protein